MQFSFFFLVALDLTTLMLPLRFSFSRAMKAQHAETQTPTSRDLSAEEWTAKSTTTIKEWLQVKLQPYAKETVFVWNSILLFGDYFLSSLLFSTIIAFCG